MNNKSFDDAIIYDHKKYTRNATKHSYTHHTPVYYTDKSFKSLTGV